MRRLALLLALAACTEEGAGGEQTLSMPACVLLCGQRAVNMNVVADAGGGPPSSGVPSGGSIQLSVAK